jgi:hypothetical protein
VNEVYRYSAGVKENHGIVLVSLILPKKGSMSARLLSGADDSGVSMLELKYLT